MKPIFWNFPFYEEQQKGFSQKDVAIAAKTLLTINPDIIFLIDESNDPHGTHGLVKDVVVEAIKKVDFSGIVVGYRVWEEAYQPDECAISLFFNDDLMSEKVKLISFYVSQIEDPAFPCKEGSFIDMMQKSNREMASRCKADFSYVECYKIIK